MTLSDDVKQQFAQDLDLIGGATIFQVYFHQDPLPLPLIAERTFFNRAAVHALRRIPSVTMVAAVAPKQEPTVVYAGGRAQGCIVLGVDAAFWRLQSFTPASGRLFGIDEVETGAKVCVIGAEVARGLFKREDVVGENVVLERDLYRIVGVLEGLRVGEGVRLVFLPITTALSRLPDMTLPGRLFVRCRTWDDVESAAAEAPRILAEHVYADRLRVYVDRTVLKRVQQVAFRIEVFAQVSVAVALVLGGIGIWNVMTASVRSRTREIGLKKAMGAQDEDILLQFLAESLVVSLGAAVAGMLLGVVAVEAVSFLLGRHPPAALELRSVGWSFAIALALGVSGGLLPSLEASRMEVSSTLRYE
jgi:putative ABC transport system permease protein